MDSVLRSLFPKILHSLQTIFKARQMTLKKEERTRCLIIQSRVFGLKKRSAVFTVSWNFAVYKQSSKAKQISLKKKKEHPVWLFKRGFASWKIGRERERYDELRGKGKLIRKMRKMQKIQKIRKIWKIWKIQKVRDERETHLENEFSSSNIRNLLYFEGVVCLCVCVCVCVCVF